MLTQDALALLILRGQSLRAQSVRALANIEYQGGQTSFRKINALSQLITALKYCLSIGDYTSKNCLAVFSNLSQCLEGKFLDGITTDGQAQPPGGNIVVITTGGGSSTDVQIDQFDFDGFTASLTNYQTNYAPRFGNDVIPSIYVVNPDTGVGFIQDNETQPAILYVNNDKTQGIDSITWTFGISTSGYMQLLGIKPS